MARGDTLLLGTRKGLAWYERENGRWKLAHVAHEGNPIAYATLDARDGAAWVCIDHGHWGQKLSRSSDRGRSWEEIPAPKYPDGAEIVVGFPGQGERKRQPATLRYAWVLVPGGADQPGRMYLGTEPGGLFVSNDGGATWSLCEGLWSHPSRFESWFGGGRDNPGIHTVLVDPRDSRRVMVAISTAGVFETRDDGATWQPRNKGLRADFMPDKYPEVGHDAHFVSRCAAAPDVLWQQNHCGIFRSTDNAATWSDVSEAEGPARFGFPISADERDPKTAWVVPGQSDQARIAHHRRLCVARTTDGGKTWVPQTRGLPGEPAFDIVYRHALDLAGDRLAFGSTTGNVYVSEDRGESWTCLSHHLPPVYSVRFA
jgi:photosystem II stability/assembly factor-like uncharacterized protein